jgi:hypothetical protein
VNGKELEAMTLFTQCIKFLKINLLEEIKKTERGTTDTDIQYVLTVPSIWGDKAKMFMREAAVKVCSCKEYCKTTFIRGYFISRFFYEKQIG